MEYRFRYSALQKETTYRISESGLDIEEDNKTPKQLLYSDIKQVNVWFASSKTVPLLFCDKAQWIFLAESAVGSAVIFCLTVLGFRHRIAPWGKT